MAFMQNVETVTELLDKLQVAFRALLSLKIKKKTIPK